YQGHADPRIRKRFKWESRDLVKYGVPMVAAAAEYFLDQPLLQTRLSNVLDELFDEFGELAEHFAKVVAPSLLEQIRDEQLRLQDGWTYEPPTFYEKNDAWLAIEKQGNARATVTAVEG
ncbi:MAG: hypothetical protein QGG09_09495, partial [Pirellulaceae bacterium]|nr:hypothetical protein [Pirellulaceae bacterium]